LVAAHELHNKLRRSCELIVERLDCVKNFLKLLKSVVWNLFYKPIKTLSQLNDLTGLGEGGRSLAQAGKALITGGRTAYASMGVVSRVFFFFFLLVCRLGFYSALGLDISLA
jgi:hypothetical protein